MVMVALAVAMTVGEPVGVVPARMMLYEKLTMEPAGPAVNCTLPSLSTLRLTSSLLGFSCATTPVSCALSVSGLRPTSLLSTLRPTTGAPAGAVKESSTACGPAGLVATGVPVSKHRVGFSLLRAWE